MKIERIERIEKIINSMKDIEGRISTSKFLERLHSISFWELLSECTKIEIPIIQRDFAQGRRNKKTAKIRGLFLDSLIKAIKSDNESIELDFVYGDIKNGIFQPLDGQQRLTTLFLLYWYFAFKSGNLSKANHENKNQFKKFTYETRISSREFCNELVEKAIELGEGETLSEKITDASWFFLSWKNDPTIKAMLVMLDNIESKLKDRSSEELNKGWNKLISGNPPITFHFKQLNDIGLTDELYIKMNARGKALTDFENFKARFEKYIKENKFENELVLNEANKAEWKDLTEKTFSHKIDSIWTDLFWKHRGDDNLVDNEFVKFIAGIAINAYAMYQEIDNKIEDKLIRKILEEKKEKNITDEAVKRERIERRITLLFNNPNEITPEDFPSKKSFEYLKNCFDSYANKELKYDELKPELELWDFLEIKPIKINNKQELDNNLFIEFIKDVKTEYKQRVLFYAQTQFLLTVETFNSKAFTDWMRVVRNIVQNATIDSAGTFIGAIGIINELSSECSDVYNFLSKNSITSRFASNQMKEEIAKAQIIIKEPDAKSVIHKTEDTNFCKGKISFPLYCIDFEIDNSSVFEISKLEKILTVINTNFSNLNDNLSDEFKRAFLTIKENKYYEVWCKWSYSFESYKCKLLKTVFDLKNSFSESIDWKRDYLKELVVKLIDNTLNDIINEYKCPDEMPNWKKRLIKEDLIKEATFILIPTKLNYCKLAWQQRPSREDQVKMIE